MLLFHLYLAGSAWTTWEIFRKDQIFYLAGQNLQESPFNMGLLYNLKSVFCNRGIPKNWIMHKENMPKSDTSLENIQELSIFC